MALDAFHLMLLLLIGASGFAVFLLLPSIIEILHPRDRGPRKILKKPLLNIMKRELKSTIFQNPESIDDVIALNSLQDFLKEIDVKFHIIGNDTIRILSNIVFPANFQAWDNMVVEGDLTIGDHCVFHGSVKAKGNVIVGNRVVLDGNLISKGNVDIKDEAVISGLVHSEGLVRIGEEVFIGLSVVTDGDVELHENSEVRKSILGQGVIRVLKHPKLDLSPALDDIG